MWRRTAALASGWGRRQSGQSLVEFGLIVTVVSIIMIVVLTAMGQNVIRLMTQISTSLGSA